ncbi:hypothetical protein BC332_18055 [Capsicum chinense]|nr:hypothetical protein BC332_18055 [Capsicum chinense]
MGIGLTIARQNPSFSISMFAKLSSFLSFMKPTLIESSFIFIYRRSDESIQLDAVLVPRREGKEQDIGHFESDCTFLRSNGYRSWPYEKRVEHILALT